MNFSLKHTILLGWPILSVLLAFSVVSLAIFLQCWTLLRKCRGLVNSVGQSDRKILSHALAVVEQRLAILGTIANAAPFVGLLGTVIGVIRAFHSISTATGSGSGLTLVAGGISEALVSTAAGLAVAIPASMIFNYFTYQSQKIAQDAGLD
ncbi:MAG TPA: MotA/TolQ/ExbB proton channel family protein [Elusimicrobiota bacterium]|nr:MotA/TolQ/ExbB proton channel family protein [Elusimicrobiota bacterium]